MLKNIKTMIEEKDKFDDIIDWLEPQKELTDEELASLMQDGDAMSDFKIAMDAQQAVVRHSADKEGLPFDIDQEWNKLSAFIDEEEKKEENNKKIEEADFDNNKTEETKIEEMPQQSKRKPLYITIGIAASLLILIAIRYFINVGTSSTPITNTAMVFQRDSTAGNVAILTSSDKSYTPQALQGEGIVMPKSPQQPAASATTRILHALGLESDDVALQNNTVTIPLGKSYNITLADGTKVFMYAGSRLTYPVAFSGKERRVYLEGEAYFKVTNILNKKSGVLGVSGVSSDFRDLDNAAAEGNERAQLALDMFHYWVAKVAGSYVAAMNGVDAIVFTAGVGENSKSSRKAIAEYFGYLGVTIDDEANSKRGEDIMISTPDSKVKVFVIPTNEELVIARDTRDIVG